MVALVEVKLSELDFGHCSAYESPHNDRRDVCGHDGAFGGDPAACFQLRNHGAAHRRRYDLALEPLAAVQPGGGCAFRRGGNQPMRNVALAGMLQDSEEATAVAYALCAPAGNRAIWRRWGEVSELLGGQAATLRELPAEDVLRLRPADQADRLAQNYALTR